MRRRAVVQMVLIALVAGVATGAVAYLIPWLPEQASKEADRIDAAYWFVVIIRGVILPLVARLSVSARR